MFVVLDTETDGLVNPTRIWVAVVKEVDSGKVHTFRHLHQDKAAGVSLNRLLAESTGVIGHNIIGYDLGVLKGIAGIGIDPAKVVDTLVVAKLLNYGADGGNSLDAIGERLGYPTRRCCANGPTPSPSNLPTRAPPISPDASRCITSEGHTRLLTDDRPLTPSAEQADWKSQHATLRASSLGSEAGVHYPRGGAWRSHSVANMWFEIFWLSPQNRVAQTQQMWLYARTL